MEVACRRWLTLGDKPPVLGVGLFVSRLHIRCLQMLSAQVKLEFL